MKIQLKTDPETLFVLHKITRDSTQFHADSRSKKVEKSLKMELFEILSKRCISYSFNPNGKLLTITVKFYLADLLYDIVDSRQWSLEIFEFNKIEILKNQLHKKLL